MLAAMFAEQTGAASGMNANIRTIGGEPQPRSLTACQAASIAAST